MPISPVICRVRMKYDRWDVHITNHVWTQIDTWLLTCPCQVVGLKVRRNYDRWDANITSHVWTRTDTWLLTCPCQWFDWRSEGIMTGEVPISPVMFELELTHDCWHAHVSGLIKGQKELWLVRCPCHQSCLGSQWETWRWLDSPRGFSALPEI